MTEAAAVSEIANGFTTYARKTQDDKKLQATVTRNYGPLLSRFSLSKELQARLYVKLIEREASLNDLRSYFVERGELNPDPEFFKKAAAAAVAHIDAQIISELPASLQRLYQGYVLHPQLFRFCDETTIKLSYSETPLTQKQRTLLDDALLEASNGDELLELAQTFLKKDQLSALAGRIEMTNNMVKMREIRLRIYEKTSSQ